jgi:hypothetical protein
MGDTTVTNESNAGFGIPINQNRNEPIHWWTPDDKRACDHHGSRMMYVGPRETSVESFIERGLCIDCVNEVVAAAKVLGFPKGFPYMAMVKIREEY